MGWWSETIMGGDTPLDYMGMLCDLIGVKYVSPKGFRYTRKQIETHMPKVLAWLNKPRYENEIAWQVFGVMVMETGAKISVETRAKIIQAAKADTWMTEDGTHSSRGHHIRAFIKAIEAHKAGQKTKSTCEDLFQVLDKRLAQGAR